MTAFLLCRYLDCTEAEREVALLIATTRGLFKLAYTSQLTSSNLSQGEIVILDDSTFAAGFDDRPLILHCSNRKPPKPSP